MSGVGIYYGVSFVIDPNSCYLQTEPFAFMKQSTSRLEGNDRYEGYAIDLIKELSEMSGFSYTITIQEDTKSGNLDEKTKQWTGMIGEIINGVRRDKIRALNFKRALSKKKIYINKTFENYCWTVNPIVVVKKEI